MPDLVPSDLHSLRIVGTGQKLPKRHSFSQDMDAEWRERKKQRKRKQKKIEYTPDWLEKMRVQKKFHSSKNRKKLAAQGNALPDGSYPIADTEDLQNAATLARSGHGDAAAAKRLVARRAKQLGAKNPLDEKESTVSKSNGVLLPFSSCFSNLTE
jgi:hypothetical protein